MVGLVAGVADQLTELALQRIALVPPVPEEGKPTIRAEYAVQLGDRSLAVEPVIGLGCKRRIDACIRERDRLGGPNDRLRVRHCVPELLEHRPSRLHSDDVEAEPDEAA